MTSTFPPISAPTACVWVNGDAAEAATYYARVLPLTASAPAPGMGTLSIDGTDLLLLGADATYSPNPSISGFLRFSPDRFGSLEQAEQGLRHTHTAISEGGELMPLQAYPFAPLFAWVRDRYGFTWQLFLEENPSDLPFFTPCFMFGKAAHGKCEEATNTWMELLGGERCGWCLDAYGVSWQVLPHNIGELMADTDARAKLLSMGKIDLNQL